MAKRSRQSLAADAASAGFTLVEILVTTVAAGILIGGVHIAYVAQTSTSSRARDAVIANSFAEGKVESLRSKGYLGLSDGTTNLTSSLPSELKAPRSASMTITSQTSSVKRIVVTITYSDRGTARTYQYTTYVGELGVGQY
jgi:prepilin-type N-terminal cleavage/methylation domain-containing protein